MDCNDRIIPCFSFWLKILSYVTFFVIQPCPIEECAMNNDMPGNGREQGTCDNGRVCLPDGECSGKFLCVASIFVNYSPNKHNDLK